MDFDGAIQAHTNWKLRLFSYCRGKVAEKIDMQTPLSKEELRKAVQSLQLTSPNPSIQASQKKAPNQADREVPADLPANGHS